MGWDPEAIVDTAGRYLNCGLQITFYFKLMHKSRLKRRPLVDRYLPRIAIFFYANLLKLSHTSQSPEG
jgi:hypothetical protein